MEERRWTHWLLPIYAFIVTILMIVGWYRWSDSQSALQTTTARLNATTIGQSAKTDKTVLTLQIWSLAIILTSKDDVIKLRSYRPKQ